LLKNSVNYNLDKKFGSLNVNYHNLESDGWRQNSDYHREGVTIAGELLRKANSKLTYFSNYTYLKAFVPSSVDKKTFDENPRAAAATWLASKGYKEYKSVLSGLGYEFKISNSIKNATSVFINYKDNYETRPFDILQQYTFASGGRTQFSGNFDIGIPTNFIVGVEYFNDDYHDKTSQNLYKNNNANGSLEGYQLSGTNQKRNFYNAFAQTRFLFSKKIELQAGINSNKTHFALNTTFPAAATAAEKYTYDVIWSPQVSLLFKPNASQTIYASASYGYSLPSVDETLTANGSVNSDIKPETGWNYEFYFFNKKIYTEIAVYRMEITHLLVARRIGDDQYVGVNAGETLHQGIEVSINHLWQLKNGFSLNSYASASIGKYEFEQFDDNGNNFSGNELTGVAANKANAGIIFSTRFGWYLSADFQFVDKLPLNDPNSVYADAYKTVNAKTGYRFEILPKLYSQLAFGINNLTNEHYASLILPNAAAPPNGSPRYYYPGLPINYYGQVGLSYSF